MSNGGFEVLLLRVRWKSLSRGGGGSAWRMTSGSAEGSVLGRESVFPPLVPVLLACAVSLLGHVNFSFLCGEN